YLEVTEYCCPPARSVNKRGWDDTRLNLNRPFSVKKTESSLRSPSYNATVCIPPAFSSWPLIVKLLLDEHPHSSAPSITIKNKIPLCISLFSPYVFIEAKIHGPFPAPGQGRWHPCRLQWRKPPGPPLRPPFPRRVREQYGPHSTPSLSEVLPIPPRLGPRDRQAPPPTP